MTAISLPSSHTSSNDSHFTTTIPPFYTSSSDSRSTTILLHIVQQQPIHYHHPTMLHITQRRPFHYHHPTILDIPVAAGCTSYVSTALHKSNHLKGLMYNWTIEIPSFPVPPVPSEQTSGGSEQCNRLILKAHKTDHTIHLIFTLCTGFQSMLESNTNFVLVLSFLLVRSVFQICARFTHHLCNSNLLQTSVY